MTPNFDLLRRGNIVAWIAAVTITFVGLTPAMTSPVLGDDLVVIAEGFAERTSGQGVLGYAASYADQMIAGGHVLPVGGLFSAVQVSVVEFLSRTGVSVSLAWGISRVTLIVISLIALAVAMGYWLSRDGARRRNSFNTGSLLAFLLASSLFIGTIQIHGAWSQDPVLSYALASWGTPALGLTYFLLAGVLLRKRTPSLLLIGLVVFGLVGVLLYEPFIVAVGAAYVAVLLQVMLSQPERAQWLRLALFTGVTLVVCASFALIQAWRVSQPSEYSGTQVGFRDMIIPTWVTGFLSSVPLTSTPLALRETPPLGGFPLLVVVPILISVVLALGAYRIVRKGDGFQVNARAATPPAVFLLLLWAGTALVFATSSKYQLEVGTQLGRTYLFYATGTLAFCGLATVGLLWLAPLSRAVFPVFVVVLISIAGWQWSVNARSLGSIEVTYGWTRIAADSLSKTVDVEQRCWLFERISQRDIPAFYRDGVASSLTDVYEYRFGLPYCEASVE